MTSFKKRQLSLFSFAALVESVAVENGPDPSDEQEWNEDALKYTSDHGGWIDTLLVDDTGNEKTKSWGNELEDENDEGSGLRNISPRLFAAWEVVFLSGLAAWINFDFDIHS